MPIYIDILENKVLGPPFKKGREEGLREGELKGELKILRRQVEARFGPIPAWANERLSARSTASLEDLGERLLDAPTLEYLLQQP